MLNVQTFSGLKLRKSEVFDVNFRFVIANSKMIYPLFY